MTTASVGVVISIYCDLFSSLDLLAKERLIKNPLVTFIVTPLFFWVAAYLCRKFSPNSAGSNLEHIKSALEQTKHYKSSKQVSNSLSFKSALVSIVSSLVCSFGGGALGREGPSVYIAASFFAGVSEKLKKIIPKINPQNWIFAGSAVGLAVAFNAPFAGLMYVTEKLVKNRYYNFNTNMFCTLVAMTVFAFFLEKENSVFNIYDLGFTFETKQILLMILISAICGFVAFFFKKINFYFYQITVGIKSKFWHLVPIIAGLVVAITSFYCGIYSFSGGIETANAALNGHVLLSYKEVLGRLLNTTATFLSGSAGGLVAPAVTIGAGIASIVATIFSYAGIKILILTGMVAFLAVVLEEPITSAIIIYEATNQSTSSLPFLILASTTSILIVKLLKTKNDRISKLWNC
ncbi:MAG: H+/Cl- antiporter ClcA [Rickettsiales bacterium]|jgi:H+/Cl- antiporter ClcA